MITLEEFQPPNPLVVGWSRLQQRVAQMTFGRRIFHDGRDFLGLGPESMEVGDIVVVLLGGPTPYTLRPLVEDPKRYKLVGECYVSGIMNCEALQHKGFNVPVTGEGRCSSPLEWFTLT